MTIIHNWLSNKVLHIRYLDSVSGHDLLQAALEISGDPRFDNLRAIIGDWSQAHDSAIGVEDVERLAACVQAISRSNTNIINITVMRQDGEAPQALVSLYQMLITDTPWQATAVHSFEQAKEQLHYLFD